MRSGFEVYRAFEQDEKDVQKAIKEGGKLKCPVLASGGDASEFAKVGTSWRACAWGRSWVVLPRAGREAVMGTASWLWPSANVHGRFGGAETPDTSYVWHNAVSADETISTRRA
jgi:hypothetical protein